MTARSMALRASLAAVMGVASGCDGGPTSSTGLADATAPGTGATGATGGDDACMNLPTAPRDQRVDLATPVFPNPTEVTNPLFPISRLFRVIQLGTVDGQPFRAETTLLPETKTIELDGKPVETLVSQYLAFSDGRIHETALDFYAQADDGAAWYFGEDVFNYEDGSVADTEGTWLAGRDGPAAMIMPADPQVGDVYRPENICGLVFEEVTIQAVDVPVDGPRGPVAGAIIARELHMDGTTEDKTFAPDYGEFATGSEGNSEVVALAIPIDALPGFPPKQLETLSGGASEIFEAAQAEDWEAASAAVGEMTAAWDDYKTSDVPPLLENQMGEALVALGTAVEAQEGANARQTAIDAARAALDLKLRHRTAAETDLDHLDLFARQILVDSEAGDRGAVIGDAAAIRWIRDRIARDVTFADLRQIDARIAGLRAAVQGRNLAGAAAVAMNLRATLARMRVSSHRK